MFNLAIDYQGARFGLVIHKSVKAEAIICFTQLLKHFYEDQNLDLSTDALILMDDAWIKTSKIVQNVLGIM